jgi:hypothetical protein
MWQTSMTGRQDMRQHVSIDGKSAKVTFAFDGIINDGHRQREVIN